MRICCLTPTWGKPTLVANLVAQFERQTHLDRHLLILDDGGQIAEQQTRQVTIRSTATRYPHLPAKYHAMLEMSPECDAFALMDDDDVYLPHHLAVHAVALEHAEWSHPSTILSTYGRKLHAESAAGRFHGALAFTRRAIDAVGGWRQDARADFDQDLIARLRHRFGEPADPCQYGPLSYVYRWESSQSVHCSGLMLTPDNTDWYARTPKTETRVVGQLVPRMDAETERLYATLPPRP